ncbi:hypothetical protein [Nonomuraea sp. KM90]|uniref:hypothetical protein n=1 Tax=Nonomuraea sp. KM90 TaxID=3457428 RepID=UPI003FCC9F71
MVIGNTETLMMISQSLMDPEEEREILTALRQEELAISAKVGIYGTLAVWDRLVSWVERKRAVIGAHIRLREFIEDNPGAKSDL